MIELVRGFWWAFARCLQVKEPKDGELDKFRRLARNCVVDFTFFVDDTARTKAAFQQLITTEHRRDTGGFTGFRRISLVAWAADALNNEREQITR